MNNKLTKTIRYVLDEQLKIIQDKLSSDVLCINGPIDSITSSLTRNALEHLYARRPLNNKLTVILTNGLIYTIGDEL